MHVKKNSSYTERRFRLRSVQSSLSFSNLYTSNNGSLTDVTTGTRNLAR